MTLTTLTQHPSFWPALTFFGAHLLALLIVLYALYVEKKVRAARSPTLPTSTPIPTNSPKPRTDHPS